MCDGKICTGQSPSTTFPYFICILASDPLSSQTTTVHASAPSSLPKMSDFSFKTRIAYTLTSAFLLVANHSKKIMSPSKRWCRKIFKHGLAVASVSKNRSTTSTPGLENVSTRFHIQPTFLSFRRANRLLSRHSRQSEWRIPACARWAEKPHPFHLSTNGALLWR